MIREGQIAHPEWVLGIKTEEKPHSIISVSSDDEDKIITVIIEGGGSIQFKESDCPDDLLTNYASYSIQTVNKNTTAEKNTFVKKETESQDIISANRDDKNNLITVITENSGSIPFEETDCPDDLLTNYASYSIQTVNANTAAEKNIFVKK